MNLFRSVKLDITNSLTPGLLFSEMINFKIVYENEILNSYLDDKNFNTDFVLKHVFMEKNVWSNIINQIKFCFTIMTTPIEAIYLLVFKYVSYLTTY
jgi:hypothetical protein